MTCIYYSAWFKWTNIEYSIHPLIIFKYAAMEHLVNIFSTRADIEIADSCRIFGSHSSESLGNLEALLRCNYFSRNHMLMKKYLASMNKINNKSEAKEYELYVLSRLWRRLPWTPLCKAKFTMNSRTLNSKTDQQCKVILYWSNECKYLRTRRKMKLCRSKTILKHKST